MPTCLWYVSINLIRNNILDFDASALLISFSYISLPVDLPDSPMYL